ncbi:MAG: TAXI family TRAP transporter solute-binding subunit [Gammaproteobacteria bacterium]|nr:TAXI family TRAP transporter solute-binding subunit [Gammaproteobacteria bacterium]
MRRIATRAPLILGIVFCVGVFMFSKLNAANQFIDIGTGGVTGVYYPTGSAICRLVNKNRNQHGIRCSAESTGGSIYNINTIRAGEFEFGVAQSDWQYHAYHGSSKFADKGKFDKLRAVFSVHPEPVTVIARDGSGIAKLSDVKGKRLNIGNPGSGNRGTWEVIEEALGWNRNDLKIATEMKSAETGRAVCDGKIDAYFWLVGHPSVLTQESLVTCDTHLVHVTGPAISRLIADNSYYRRAIIPAGMYGDNPDIETFGVGATFVTSADVSEEVVYTVIKSVFDNFDDFKKFHPALYRLRKEEMFSGLSAPLHRGAVRYIKETGLEYECPEGAYVCLSGCCKK